METVHFASSDGLPLAGTFELPAEASGSCALLCHGITVDREEGGVFSDLARMLAERGLASFRFDFRGHGKSGGVFDEMTVQGEIGDARAALELVRARGFSKIGLLGASFGGGIVSYLAGERPAGVRALVLANAVLEYSIELFEKRMRDGFEIGGRIFRMSPDLFKGLPDLSPGSHLVSAGLPALFIHGDRDELVPYALSLKYSGLVTGSSLVTVPGSGHGFHEPEACRTACTAAADFLAARIV